ncbi:hypothetical protein D3C84_1043930 [compost metagenome]
MLLQPGVQRQVVGQAAEQAHRGMPMGVDQARRQQAARQLAHLQGSLLERLGARREQYDASVADAQAVLVEHHSGGLDRHQPGGEQEEVEGGFGHGGASGRLRRASL